MYIFFTISLLRRVLSQNDCRLKTCIVLAKWQSLYQILPDVAINTSGKLVLLSVLRFRVCRAETFDESRSFLRVLPRIVLF